MMQTESGPFNWPALMRAGLVRLGLQPDVFWRLTPAELQMMLNPMPGEAPLTRNRLDALLKAFPDQTEGTKGE